MLIHLSRQEYFLWAEDDSDIHILIHIGTIKPTHQAQRMAIDPAQGLRGEDGTSLGIRFVKRRALSRCPC